MSVTLEINNLTTKLLQKNNSLTIVDGFSMKIHQGQTVALVGESGSGKSMTALSVMKLLPPHIHMTDGDIVLHGKSLVNATDEDMCHIRGNDMSIIFQEPMTSLNPTLTIGEQLIEVICHHQGKNRSSALKKAMDLLNTVGFSQAEQLVKQYPHRLSGGMRQRVMIAMALCCEPSLIIADEPTTALDVTVQAHILDLLKNISTTYQTAIWLITHDLGIVNEVADTVIVMYAGQVVESAPVNTLFQTPLHPYTQGLIESIPPMHETKKRLYSIAGQVPKPGELTKGCRFAPRCSKAMETCHHQQPEIQDIDRHHQVRCLLYEHKELRHSWSK